MLTVESILRRDFNELSKPIQGPSPTEDICNNLKYGEMPNGVPELSAHERRIRANWNINRAGRVLNEVECIYIGICYGGIDYCDMLADFMDDVSNISTDELEAVLEFLLIKNKFRTCVELRDSLGWGQRSAFRKIAKVQKNVAEIHNNVLSKLEIAFKPELDEENNK